MRTMGSGVNAAWGKIQDTDGFMEYRKELARKNITKTRKNRGMGGEAGNWQVVGNAHGKTKTCRTEAARLSGFAES